MPEPRMDNEIELIRSRPRLPQGYINSEDEQGMLAWSQVDEWLAAARVYWLCTASLAGEPHATPILGTWVQGGFYFDGYYEATRWGRNLATNPRIEVHIERDNYVVMLKGSAAIVNPTPAIFNVIAAQYTAKYAQPPDTNEGLYRVQPRVYWAWDNHRFAVTATRWCCSDPASTVENGQ